MAHDEAISDIPPFAKPLVPYIKTRPDALRIRQQLTAYLRSQIGFKEDEPDLPNSHAQSHLALCVPQEAVVDVNRIPPEITGLKKQYLEALRANVAARKKYQAASEKATSARSGEYCKGEAPAADSDSEFQAYLRLLRGRQRHAKLQVFQHYLEELNSRDVAGPDHFEGQSAPSQPLASPEQVDGARPSEGEDVDGLVHKLERVVIRAKFQLDKEKKLFEETKARHESDGIHGDIPSPVKARALQRTRDELVRWIEEKLVDMGGSDGDQTQESPPDDLEILAELLVERKVQITRQYAAYVDARKRVLEAASKACQPVGAASAKPQPPVTHRDRTTPEKELPLYPLDALAFASESLLPLSKTQDALALQKSYLSGMLGKEKTTALRMLNRLSDESHLLPEYPVPARQPRFKSTAAALNSRRASSSGEPSKPDEVVRLAEAWAFASDAAAENEREYVEQKMEVGDETVQDAEKTLQQVYGMLNQDLEEATRGTQRGEPENTGAWARHARSTSLQASRIAKPAKGAWSRLDGGVDAD
ncbi:hypothetical protein PHISP_03632 [Aspergillus sp. HF37]|nr:hypothetical protein PHISP_03632 [Aspergillus sp. HF37]